MLLIIEGMDRCGKSTLVQNLRKKYFKNPNIMAHHSSSPPNVEDPNGWEKEHYESLFIASKRLVNQMNYDIIFDRFHLGAIVYGEKYRAADGKDIYELDRRFLSGYKNAALVLLTDTTDGIMFRDDGESLEQSKEDFLYSRNAFTTAFNESSCKHKLNINITKNGGVGNTYDTVAKFLDGVRNAI